MIWQCFWPAGLEFGLKWEQGPRMIYIMDKAQTALVLFSNGGIQLLREMSWLASSTGSWGAATPANAALACPQDSHTLYRAMTKGMQFKSTDRQELRPS
jgi:hypothetical protein